MLLWALALVHYDFTKIHNQQQNQKSNCTNLELDAVSLCRTLAFDSDEESWTATLKILVRTLGNNEKITQLDAVSISQYCLGVLKVKISERA